MSHIHLVLGPTLCIIAVHFIRADTGIIRLSVILIDAEVQGPETIATYYLSYIYVM